MRLEPKPDRAVIASYGWIPAGGEGAENQSDGADAVDGYATVKDPGLNNRAGRGTGLGATRSVQMHVEIPLAQPPFRHNLDLPRLEFQIGKINDASGVSSGADTDID